MGYSREDKLAHAQHLLSASEWEWYKSEIEKFIKQREFTVNYRVDANALYEAGLVAGAKWCIELPARTKKDCDTFFNKAAKLVGLLEENDEAETWKR